jgi:hypothetical protein
VLAEASSAEQSLSDCIAASRAVRLLLNATRDTLHATSKTRVLQKDPASIRRLIVWRKNTIHEREFVSTPQTREENRPKEEANKSCLSLEPCLA